QLRHAHLKVAQHLEQELLELGIGLVHLVNQEHLLPCARDRAQERPLEQELAREDVGRHLLPGAALGPVRLDAEELLLVVPLEEGARLVESLVALQADELGVEHLREHLPELGLSRPGRSLGKERLLEREGEEECRLHAARGDVARGTQPLADLLEGDLHPAPRSLSNARRQDAAYLRAVSTERNGWTRCGSHVPLPTPL